MRLQKYMAQCGVASRRKCEEMIQSGEVSVNGIVVKEMGIKVDPEKDEIRVNDKKIFMEEKHIYIMLNKPSGYITTVRDPQNRPTVMELIGNISERIYPVGRLDFESEGLLLLTNDGDAAFQLTHPRHQIDKEYIVRVEGFPNSQGIEKLRRGIDIGGFITSPAKIKTIGREKKGTLFSIVIKEGKNRQVRRMFEAIGHPVIYLKRIRMGDIELGDLKSGQWRYLTYKEIQMLKKLTLSI